MDQKAWAQMAIDRFFEGRRSPSQSRCDEIAQRLFEASTVTPVESPGSMSYTIVCSRRREPKDFVVSFRESEARIDAEVVKLAKEIHGDLVPEATYHGAVEEADPALHIYSMPYIRGSSCIEILASQAQMRAEEEAKHGVFIKHLAQYFARCWSRSQLVDCTTQQGKQERVCRSLSRLAKELPSSNFMNSFLPGLIEDLPSLFNQEYPQVLTHGDFSVTNILLDETLFKISGIVDWSLADIMPFGMDLDILLLTTGFMTRDGWHDYACKPLLIQTFWREFWIASRIEDHDAQKKIQYLAEAAGRIGAILRLTFRRNADGSPSEEVLLSEMGMSQLQAWFGGLGSLQN